MSTFQYLDVEPCIFQSVKDTPNPCLIQYSALAVSCLPKGSRKTIASQRRTIPSRNSHPAYLQWLCNGEFVQTAGEQFRCLSKWESLHVGSEQMEENRTPSSIPQPRTPRGVVPIIANAWIRLDILVKISQNIQLHTAFKQVSNSLRVGPNPPAATMDHHSLFSLAKRDRCFVRHRKL